MPTPAELLARMLATQPPNYADEKARLEAAIGPNEGDMAAVAETDPTTWQGRLRGMGLESFVAPYEALQPAPDTTYGTMLPVARDDATGDYRRALPTMARDVATGWLDMLTGMKTGEITPAASAALQATGLPMASPSGSLASGGALRQFQAATPYGAKTAAQKASTEAGRQAWMWKTPTGKFVVNAGKQPEGAKLVGRAIGDEWISGPGLMAKAGSKEGGAAQAAGKSLPMDEASRMARSQITGHTVDAYHGSGRDIKEFSHTADKTTLGGLNTEGFSFSRNPKVSNRYAQDFNKEGATVYPVRLKMDKPLNMSPQQFERLQSSNHVFRDGGKLDEIKQIFLEVDLEDATGIKPPENITDPISWIKSLGYDSLEKSPALGSSAENEILVFNPNQIRSRFANFDPAKADSADLLAARTGSPELLSTLLMQQRPPRQAENDDWLRNGGA